ncbi:unnamed protein product [Ciceribacter selenitireducens ATCC BAA-1503]|uniref:Uncharacterized protein n=1 Tax=Ciceribacter selenitireducens ATCC BAA-1503 TaxID=1336235 RepID=A0A376A9M7_9HYPH|nr:unnamed protein product [Ciceribacter selenitireducens ATCC BAA-1503]
MIGLCIYSRSALQYQQGIGGRGNFCARLGQILAYWRDSARYRSSFHERSIRVESRAGRY